MLCVWMRWRFFLVALAAPFSTGQQRQHSRLIASPRCGAGGQVAPTPPPLRARSTAGNEGSLRYFLLQYTEYKFSNLADPYRYQSYSYRLRDSLPYRPARRPRTSSEFESLRTQARAMHRDAAKSPDWEGRRSMESRARLFSRGGFQAGGPVAKLSPPEPSTCVISAVAFDPIAQLVVEMCFVPGLVRDLTPYAMEGGPCWKKGLAPSLSTSNCASTLTGSSTHPLCVLLVLVLVPWHNAECTCPLFVQGFNCVFKTAHGLSFCHRGPGLTGPFRFRS